jgi:CRISPR-associated protein Cas5d
MNEVLAVTVWGDFACFTRPEMKVERVSYPVMTPSAARGVLEAMLWKPQFSWHVREIWVLKPIQHFSILRNEVNSRASSKAARAWQSTGGGFITEDDRAQRHTLALRDVRYLIRAQQILTPAGAGEHPSKYRECFLRRVEHGQCLFPPYLGCREFVGFFAPPDGTEHPIPCSDDLGRMLFDLDYAPDHSGRGKPRFFSARLEGGILRVPPELYAPAGGEG